MTSLILLIALSVVFCLTLLLLTFLYLRSLTSLNAQLTLQLKDQGLLLAAKDIASYSDLKVVTSPLPSYPVESKHYYTGDEAEAEEQRMTGLNDDELTAIQNLG